MSCRRTCRRSPTRCCPICMMRIVGDLKATQLFLTCTGCCYMFCLYCAGPKLLGREYTIADSDHSTCSSLMPSLHIWDKILKDLPTTPLLDKILNDLPTTPPDHLIFEKPLFEKPLFKKLSSWNFLHDHHTASPPNLLLAHLADSGQSILTDHSCVQAYIVHRRSYSISIRDNILQKDRPPWLFIPSIFSLNFDYSLFWIWMRPRLFLIFEENSNFLYRLRQINFSSNVYCLWIFYEYSHSLGGSECIRSLHT
jgi:hypothetical protein